MKKSKAQKKLDIRVKAYEKTIDSKPTHPQGYKKPGSNKK